MTDRKTPEELDRMPSIDVSGIDRIYFTPPRPPGEVILEALEVIDQRGGVLFEVDGLVHDARLILIGDSTGETPCISLDSARLLARADKVLR